MTSSRRSARLPAGVLQDLRYSLRSLARNWGLITIAVLSLGVGIGANTAVFSAVDVFMLRPLPYPDSDRLYMVWIANQERGWNQVSFSVPDFRDLRDGSGTMRIAALRGGTFSLSGSFDAERLDGYYVTPGFFEVLGVQPAMGRAFTAEEERPGNDRVAIISDGLWKRRFAADPDLIGSTIKLDGVPHTVVGIMPRDFWFRIPGRDVWTPLAFAGDERRDSHFLSVLARLNDGVSEGQAVDEAQRIMGRIARDYPDTSSGHRAWLMGLHEDVFNEGFQAGTAISTVGVALVLLIACANVANLMLTHAVGRERDVAVRSALGAGRGRIVGQLFTESAIVAVLGGLLGLALAVVGIRGLVSIMPPWFPRVSEIGLSPRVLGYAAVITMLTGVIFGLAPALQASRPDLTAMLKEGGRGGSGGGGRFRRVMVIAEVALALVLLVSSSLLVQGFVRIRLADRGFDASDVLTLQTLLPEDQYPDSEALGDFYTRLSARLASLPGVTAVGGTSILPTQGNSVTPYVLAGEDFNDQTHRRLLNFRYILPGYFEALNIPVLRGRAIEERDTATSRPVVVVNQSFVERHWPHGDPIGQRIVTSRGSWEIVGVIANTREHPTSAGGEVLAFFPALQGTSRYMNFAIEATVPLDTLIEPVRAALRSVDPTIPAYDLMPFTTLIDRSLGGDTIMAKIMGALAVIALVLALGGVYGVMAYSVSQRTRELGIRTSLGARRADLVSMVMRQGMATALVGVTIGIAAALAATRGLARFLFGVSPFDPVTFGSVAGVLLLAALAATFFPALRASRVDPVVALRTE
jgi:putative ABC transport system permease protein